MLTRRVWSLDPKEPRRRRPVLGGLPLTGRSVQTLCPVNGRVVYQNQIRQDPRKLMIIISFLMGYHNLIYECVGTPLIFCFRFDATIDFGWTEECNEPHHKCKQKNATDNVLDFSRQHIIFVQRIIFEER